MYLQRHITSKETVKARHAFENAAEQRGVKILHYHADNGRFADNAFIVDCNAQLQSLSYCGVNAHFQNGIAERCIRDLQEQTRTSMLNAMNKWKKMILICLWPYAMRHANDVANATPRMGENKSPLEKFTGVPVRPKLCHFHAFGCPTYVLDNALQSGQGVPKWKHRARLGVYLGPSPSHAQTVALVLNPRTGHVSPQFHVKFDDFFETVGNSPNDMDAPQPEWKYLSGFAIKKGATDTGTKGALANLLAPWRGATKVTHVHAPTQIPEAQPTNRQHEEPTLEPTYEATDDATPQLPMETVPPTAQEEQQPLTGPSLPAARQTRSGRTVRNTPRYEQSITQRDQGLVAWEVLIDQDEQEKVPTTASQYKIQKALEIPLVFAASDNPDILYWDQAMKAHDRDKFVEAVGAEQDGHERMGNYEPVLLDQVSKRDQINTYGLVNVMQTTHQNTRSVQMESSPQRARQAARAWRSLLGHLRTSSDLADCPLFSHPFHPPWLAKPATRLRHGISPGPSADATLHEAPAGLQSQRNNQEDTRTQATTQRIRPKTDRACVEQVHGPRDARNRVQAEQV